MPCLMRVLGRQVLDGLEPVRKRPGMYIGSTGPKGLHHLVYEVVDNAVDEAQAGFASRVDVEILDDGSVSVSDDGRGIPVDIHPKTGKSALETVLTVLHAGGKFGGEKSGYAISGGLHGVGISVCNALSEYLQVTVWREQKVHVQEYQRGKPTGPLRSEALAADDGMTGTRVQFKPDPLVFTTTTEFDHSTLAGRLRELAFLNSGLAISLKKGKKLSSYCFEGGLQEYVRYLTKDKGTLFEPIHLQRKVEEIAVEISLQWCSESYSDTLLGYANSIRTVDGGTHLEGFKTALTRTVNVLARKAKLLKDADSNLSGDFIREGLTGVISVKILLSVAKLRIVPLSLMPTGDAILIAQSKAKLMEQVPNPEFEGQTKTRLGNPEARRVVDVVVSEFLLDYFDIKQNVLSIIVQRALQAARAAEAAKKARDLVRRKTVLRSTALPGKLADCAITDPKRSEIFIVEGDSAGGSAKQARDRRFQAILPLRGKILNVEKCDEVKMYKNTEIQSLITGLGLGLRGEAFDLSALRYRRIIILTDADVDGAHIRTLLLTFFFRYRRELFDHGLIFVGVPPLYKVEHGKSATYLYDEGQLRKHVESLGPGAKFHVQRFKGLGEMMPQQLWDTTMDPERRMLKRLTVSDVLQASDTISVLMGDKVEPRRQLIAEEGAKLKHSELDI